MNLKYSNQTSVWINFFDDKIWIIFAMQSKLTTCPLGALMHCPLSLASNPHKRPFNYMVKRMVRRRSTAKIGLFTIKFGTNPKGFCEMLADGEKCLCAKKFFFKTMNGRLYTISWENFFREFNWFHFWWPHCLNFPQTLGNVNRIFSSMPFFFHHFVFQSVQNDFHPWMSTLRKNFKKNSDSKLSIYFLSFRRLETL